MGVRWYFVNHKRNVLRTSHFSQSIIRKTRALTRTYTDATPKVWQSKGRRTIASISGPQNREQRSIARDSDNLRLAECPVFGREVPGKHSDFADHSFH